MRAPTYHLPYVGLVQFGTLPSERVCLKASSSQSFPIPSQVHHLPQLPPQHSPEGYPGPFSVARKGSSMTLHLQIAVEPECSRPFAVPLCKLDSFHCWDKGRLSSRSGAEPVADGSRGGAQPDTGTANKTKCFLSQIESACVGPALSQLCLSKDAAGLWWARAQNCLSG